jgi:hypothetical protein
MEEASGESNNKEKEEFDKVEIEKDMKEICNGILIKHLDGRDYEKDKLPKWTELILNDTATELKKKISGLWIWHNFLYLR